MRNRPDILALLNHVLHSILDEGDLAVMGLLFEVEPCEKPWVGLVLLDQSCRKWVGYPEARGQFTEVRLIFFPVADDDQEVLDP